MYQADLYEDFGPDAEYIKQLEINVSNCELEGLAMERALASHPITQYVRDLPFENLSLYPAISKEYGYFFKVEPFKPKRSRRIDFTKSWRKSICTENTKESMYRKNEYEMDYLTERLGSDNSEIPYIQWTLPARDTDLSKRLGCGQPITENGKMIFTACSVNKEDYIKLMYKHCWRLSCVNCMNSSAIKKGVEAEGRILSRKDLDLRKIGACDEPAHWVISPPQDWALVMMQLPYTFRKMYEMMIIGCKDHGLYAGAVVFHPWRLNDEQARKRDSALEEGWRAGPHFHVVGYGFVDTEGFRREFKGWTLKKLHPNEKIRSVRQTMAYLLTHVGLCSYMRSDIDFEEAVYDLLIPSKRRDIAPEEEDLEWSELGIYTEEFELLSTSSNDPEKHPWDAISLFERWVRNTLRGTFNTVRYFGELSYNKISTVGEYKETHCRTCPTCGASMKLLEGIDDICSRPAEYFHRSKIRTEDKEYVLQLWNKHRSRLEAEGYTILDFAMNIPQCTTPETQGVQKYAPNMSHEERMKMKDFRKVQHTMEYNPVIIDCSIRP